MGKTGVPGEAPYSACFGTGAVLCRLGGDPKTLGIAPEEAPPFTTQPNPTPLAAGCCCLRRTCSRRRAMRSNATPSPARWLHNEKRSNNAATRVALVRMV